MPTISTVHASHEVPEGKLTSLGLYVTAQEAYEMWKADPERVKVLDVRMVEEYVFLGHAAMAVNIPVAFPKYLWQANKRKYSFEINPDFIDHVKEVLTPAIPSWLCAGPVGAAPLRLTCLPRRVSRICTTSSMALKATRWTIPKASIMASGCGTAGRTLLPGTMISNEGMDSHGRRAGNTPQYPGRVT